MGISSTVLVVVAGAEVAVVVVVLVVVVVPVVEEGSASGVSVEPQAAPISRNTRIRAPSRMGCRTPVTVVFA